MNSQTIAIALAAVAVYLIVKATKDKPGASNTIYDKATDLLTGTSAPMSPLQAGYSTGPNYASAYAKRQGF